jgi:hypothetical protein
VLATLPSSYSLVSSPRYHTFPSRSWAYQSNVSSFSSPPENTRSCTTVASMPWIVLCRSVTTTTVRSGSPSASPRKTHREPGTHGM